MGLVDAQAGPAACPLAVSQHGIPPLLPDPVLGAEHLIGSPEPPELTTHPEELLRGGFQPTSRLVRPARVKLVQMNPSQQPSRRFRGLDSLDGADRIVWPRLLDSCGIDRRPTQTVGIDLRVHANQHENVARTGLTQDRSSNVQGPGEAPQAVRRSAGRRQLGACGFPAQMVSHNGPDGDRRLRTKRVHQDLLPASQGHATRA